jgi:hypothetical protein
MLAGAFLGVRRIMIALTLGLALPALAQAQDALTPDGGLDAYALAPADQPAPPPNEAPLPDDSAVLGQALVFDPASLATIVPARPLRPLPSLSDPNSLAVSRTDQPDGSGTVVVKQPLSSEWDANVGADLGLAPPADQAMPAQNDRSSGAAWASLGVPNLASVDARVDPTNEQSRLGATFSRSIPVGRRLAVTLQDSYSVTEIYGMPSDVPDPASPSHVFGNERTVKFDILPTGTSLAAGLISISSDPVTHNTLSADQQLLGPLHVTTAVTDIGQPTVNKSITAGFKLNW